MLNSDTGVCFSPDGRKIIASSVGVATGPAVVLDATSGEETLRIEGDLRSASWSADAHYIVAGAENEVRVYESATGNSIQTFASESDLMTATLGHSESRLVSVFNDNSIRSWNLQSNQQISAFPVDSEAGGFIVAVNISSDAERVANVFHGTYAIDIWDVRSQKRVRSIKVPGYQVRSLAFANSGSLIYAGGYGGRLVGLDIDLGRETKRFTGHEGRVFAIAVAPNEKQIVSGDNSGRVIIWDVASEQPLVTLTAANQPVTSVDWSVDGRHIVAGKLDGTVQIWTLPRSR